MTHYNGRSASLEADFGVNIQQKANAFLSLVSRPSKTILLSVQQNLWGLCNCSVKQWSHGIHLYRRHHARNGGRKS